MTGFTKPNSRRLERSLLICSGEWVLEFLAYGISLSMLTSYISVVVVIIPPYPAQILLASKCPVEGVYLKILLAEVKLGTSV